MKTQNNKAKWTKFLIIFFAYSTSLHATQLENSRYPELPIAEQYMRIKNVMVDGMLKNAPKSIKNKESDIHKYILSSMSVFDFEEFIIGDYNILREGNLNESIRKTENYIQTKERCYSLSRRMAMMIVSYALDIHKRKVLKPDEITKPLFARSLSKKDDQIISWIEKEESKEIFHQNTKNKYDLEAKDKVYYYKSSKFSWKYMFGRAGYAIFRNNKLIRNIRTKMN